jgi:hypothetical protein
VFFGCACSRAPSEGLFSLDGVSTAFRIFIVSFKENANADSLIQPALQFLNVEFWFLMLPEGSTLGISLLFFWNHYGGARLIRHSRAMRGKEKTRWSCFVFRPLVRVPDD